MMPFVTSSGRGSQRTIIVCHTYTYIHIHTSFCTAHINSIRVSIHMYRIAVARRALTQRSKGQTSRSHGYENHHGRTVASDYTMADILHTNMPLCYLRLLPAWVCMSIRLPMFSSYNICLSIFWTNHTTCNIYESLFAE